MPRPQFSLKTLLWLMVVVAAFLGGAAWQRRQWEDERWSYEGRLDDRDHLIRALRKSLDAVESEN